MQEIYLKSYSYGIYSSVLHGRMGVRAFHQACTYPLSGECYLDVGAASGR